MMPPIVLKLKILIERVIDHFHPSRNILPTREAIIESWIENLSNLDIAGPHIYSTFLE